jgi:hypothetical protein
MDEVGVEIGLRLLGLSRKVEGIHVTVPFVTTSNSAEAPMQILVSGETSMEFSNTSKVTGTVIDPQLSEITTLNVVVEEIVAVGLKTLGLSSKLAGVQL